MSKLARRRPSPAMVVALIALVFSCAGVGYAAVKIGTKQLKNGAVTKKKIKNNAVAAKKIKNGAVAEAKIRNGAVSADKLAPAEAWHEVGAPGEPGFQNGWANDTIAGFATAAFYKDHLGVVHLRGLVDDGANATIFTLPPGYRPSANEVHLIHRFSGSGSLAIIADGQINPLSGSGNASLSGITFRAGG